MTPKDLHYLQPLAIFGVSSRGQGFGALAFRELRKAGIEAYAVNPKGGQWNGETLFTGLQELPKPPLAAIILIKGMGAITAVEEAAANGVKKIWLQGGSDSPEIRERCAGLGLETLRGECILMRSGGFPHNLHRLIHDFLARKRRWQRRNMK